MRSGGPEVNSEQLKKDKSRCLVYDIMYVIICVYIYIYMCNNGNGADNSNNDTSNNHHADIYIYICVCMCIYSYIHCYSGVCRDQCSLLWLYTKCCDYIPSFRQGMSSPIEKNNGTITTNWVWELQNGSVIEIALGLPKPFFTMGFLIIHSSWWREALTNLHGIHCEPMFQGPRNWGFEANYPNHLSLTNLRQNGIVGLCVKVVNFFKISRYGGSGTIFTEQNPSKSNLFFGSNHFEFNWAAQKKGANPVGNRYLPKPKQVTSCWMLTWDPPKYGHLK